MLGFLYEDDPFRFVSEPDYASGSYVKTAKSRDGRLELTLGGSDDDVVRDMSGGFTKGFRLEEEQVVTLTFRYKHQQSEDYLRREFTDLRVAVDGEAVKIDGKTHFARLRGDGEGGPVQSTGWKTMEVTLGLLDAGRHEFTLGAYGNKKSAETAVTKVWFDDVTIEGEPLPTPDLGKFEKQVLKLTNAFREKHGLDPVRAEANLTAAAEDWSRAMAKGDFFRHSEKPEQIEDFGYSARGYGENIAAGYATAKAVVEGWIDSPGHRANMLREDFEHIGIGHYRQKDDGGEAPYGHYWTQIFADPSNDYLG